MVGEGYGIEEVRLIKLKDLLLSARNMGLWPGAPSSVVEYVFSTKQRRGAV